MKLLFAIAHSSDYQRHVDTGADNVAGFAPDNTGVFMGYDFHLTPEGPWLIEVNTNAGGALLNGLHTAALCDPLKLSCLCDELLPVATMQQRIVRTFIDEFEAERGRGVRPRRIAIADERPGEPFLSRSSSCSRRCSRNAGDQGLDLRHGNPRAPQWGAWR